MNSQTPSNERLMDLLATRATQGLTPEETRELADLLRENPGVDENALDLAATALYLGIAGGHREKMPDNVRRALVARGEEWAQSAAAGRSEPLRFRSDDGVRSRPGRLQVAGWVLAAACLILAVLGWWPRLVTTVPPARLTPAEQRRLLLATPGVLKAAWADWDNPEIKGVTGDVVWDPGTQQGFMRFVGLPPNDPAREQYQLWIVDERGLQDASGQSARISGGVFDGAAGEVIVPIRAPITVGRPALFAVTIERPGGTWVSDMTRRVVVGPIRGG